MNPADYGLGVVTGDITWKRSIRRNSAEARSPGILLPTRSGVSGKTCRWLAPSSLPFVSETGGYAGPNAFDSSRRNEGEEGGERRGRKEGKCMPAVGERSRGGRSRREFDFSEGEALIPLSPTLTRDKFDPARGYSPRGSFGIYERDGKRARGCDRLAEQRDSWCAR